jgi:hypothetical protein
MTGSGFRNHYFYIKKGTGTPKPPFFYKKKEAGLRNHFFYIKKDTEIPTHLFFYKKKGMGLRNHLFTLYLLIKWDRNSGTTFLMKK